jgi:signal transduction histidine kinase
MRNTLRSRVYRYGMIFLGLFLASVTIIFASLYFLLFSQLEGLQDDIILHEAEALVRRFAGDDEAAMVAELNHHLDAHPGYAGVYLLQDRQRVTLAGNLAAWPAERLTPGGIATITYPDADGGPPRTAAATVCLLPGGYRLLVGRDASIIGDLRRLLHRDAVHGLAIALGLGLAVATAMSFGLSRRLERVNRTTLEVLEAGPHVRVPLNGSGDEFDRLAGNMNSMLDRIEQLLERLEGASDVIAHDLRSPLNRLRSRLEDGLRAGPGADCSAILAENMEDTERLLATFNSLLTIARVRGRSDRSDFEPVDLAGVIAEAAEFYGPVAEDRAQSIVVEAEGPAVTQGRRNLLLQAVFNLVDNALKFSPEGAGVTLSASGSAKGAVVSVRDTGPGIPAAFRDTALERFARHESSRDKPGQGLGLSLVQVVMEFHGGRVELDDGRPGLVVRLVFPGRAA